MDSSDEMFTVGGGPDFCSFLGAVPPVTSCSLSSSHGEGADKAMISSEWETKVGKGSG